MAVTGTVEAAPRRRRLSAELRRQSILEAASDFFAEFGFNGQMTDLAVRMGISHSLIFRYFPTKQALLEAVFHHVHLKLWAQVESGPLSDRSRPVRARMEEFLLDFLNNADNPRWVRIGLYAALANLDIAAKRQLTSNVWAVMDRVLVEVEHEYGLTPIADPQLRLEIGWHMYSSVVLWLMRKYVVARPYEEDKAKFVSILVGQFLYGYTASKPQRPHPTAGRRKRAASR